MNLSILSDPSVLSIYLSISLFLLSILVSIQVYYSQSSFAKRVSWCRRTRKNKSWIVLFNGSKRILLKEDVYDKAPLTIDIGHYENPEIIGWELFDKEPKLVELDKKQVRIDFKHMEPNAFLVIEMNGGRVPKAPKTPRVPYLKGHLIDGDINEKRWKDMTISHNLVFYLFFLLLPWGIYLFFLFRAFCKKCFVFNLPYFLFTLICFVIICLALFSVDTFRRIPYKSFKKAKKCIRNNK